MGKSKYSHPAFPTVSTVESGDTSKDISKMDRSGTSTSGPSASSNSDKSAAGTLGNK